VKKRKRSGDDTDTDFQAESEQESADEEAAAAMGGDEVAPNGTPARTAVAATGFNRPKPQPKGASTKALAQAVAKISSRSSPMSKTLSKKPSTPRGTELKKVVKKSAATGLRAMNSEAPSPTAVKRFKIQAPSSQVAKISKSTLSTKIPGAPTMETHLAGNKPQARKASKTQAPPIYESAPLQPFRLSLPDILPLSIPASKYHNADQLS